MRRLTWLVLAALSLCLPPVWAATDAEIAAMLPLIADPASGSPMAASRIDFALFQRLYSQPNAAKTLQEILIRPGFEQINTALGKFRADLIDEVGAQIAHETGVRIEVNNGGKQNGAMSDADLFIFTAAPSLPGFPDAQSVHEHILTRFRELWQKRTGLLAPGVFDIALIPGDSLLVDWRMSKLKPSQFAAKLAAQIARLSATEGAYWVPGGYKPQVHTRYIADGQTTVHTPELTSPRGVKTEKGATSKLSLLYKGVPVHWDRGSVLESVLQNEQQRDHVTQLVKRIKYFTRIGDPRLLSNLEVDYRRLNLQGKSDIIVRNLRKILADVPIPPELGDHLEIARVFFVADRIELDKIIRAMGTQARPKWWAPEWQSYQPQDYNTDAVKEKYFSTEIQAVLLAARAQGEDLSTPDQLAERVRRAEALFLRKVELSSCMFAQRAAIQTFQEVFTRQGYVKYRYLYGADAARRQLIERAYGLRSILAYLDDPDLIRGIMAHAPPEVRDLIGRIAEIPETQRQLIAQGGHLVAEDLAAIDDVIKRLQMRLELDDIHPIRDEIPDSVMRDRRMMRLAEEVQRRSPRSNPDDAPAFLRFAGVPTGPNQWLSEAWGRAYDLGTVTTLGDIWLAYQTGDAEGAVKKGKDFVGNVVMGPLYDFSGAILRDLRGRGDPWPLLQLGALTAAGQGAAWAGYGPQFAVAMFLYGMSNLASQYYTFYYLKPTENTAVSYVLMGDESAVVDRTGSSFPEFRNQPEVRAHAILPNHVDLPDFPPPIRSEITRSLLFPAANAETMKELPPGTVRADPNWNWRDAFQSQRDRRLAGYNPEYWLRRMVFYQRVLPQFASWVRGINSDSNWQRCSTTPPRVIADLSESERKSQYPDAYYERVGGVLYWDHERIWLRRFFDTWVAAYMRRWGSLPERPGTFYYELYRHAPGWQQAVVTELVNYYAEGQRQSLDGLVDSCVPQPVGDSAKTKQALLETIKRATDSVKARADKTIDQYKRVEGFYWHASIAQRLERTLLAAGERLGPLPSRPPELRLRLYSPVTSLNGDLEGEVLVIGDLSSVPDDIQTAITFSDLRPVRGRPAEISRWRVETLLGPNVPDARLLVLKGTATFTVTAPSRSSFALSATHDVRVVAENPTPILTERRRIRVPDVARMNGQAAAAAIDALGLRPKTVVTAAAPTPEQKFLAHGSRPPAGSEVEANAEIEIEIYGDAVAQLTVPNVVGRPVVEAEALLVARGLTPRRELIGPAPAGQTPLQVAGQEPAPGAPARRDDYVTIAFYDHPLTTVPPLIGRATRDAENILRGQGLAWTWRSLGSAPSQNMVDHVINQNPAAGQGVTAGSTIALTYYDTFVALLEIPDVRNWPAKQASDHLGSLGFNVRLVRAGTPPSPAWSFRVFNQNPLPPARVSPGAEVTIEFYGELVAPQFPTMPDLTTGYAPDAEQTLNRLRVRAQFRPVGRARQPSDSLRVVGQHPPPGTPLGPNISVGVDYLEEFRGRGPGPGPGPPPGPPVQLMPDLVNLDHASARSIMDINRIAADWRLLGPAPRPDLVNRVVRQSIPRMTLIPPGALPVVEYYGPFGGGNLPPPLVVPPVRDPRQQQLVPLPDVTNRTDTQALNILGSRGFIISKEYVGRAQASNQSFLVVRTQPPPGTMVPPGSAVTISVLDQYVAPEVRPPGPPPGQRPPGPPPQPGYRCPGDAPRVGCPVAGSLDSGSPGCLVPDGAFGGLVAVCEYGGGLAIPMTVRLELHINYTRPPQGGCGAVIPEQQISGDRLFRSRAQINSSSRRAFVTMLGDPVGVAIPEAMNGARDLLRRGEAQTQMPCR